MPDKPSDAEIGEVNSFQNHMYDYPTNQSYTDIFAFRGATHGPTKENPVPGRPAAFDPADAEPATITNLNAAVGLAYVSGMVTQTNIKTGDVVRLPFVDSDMRFMQGVFRGTDGKVHRGAFAFV